MVYGRCGGWYKSVIEGGIVGVLEMIWRRY